MTLRRGISSDWFRARLINSRGLIADSIGAAGEIFRRAFIAASIEALGASAEELMISPALKGEQKQENMKEPPTVAKDLLKLATKSNDPIKHAVNEMKRHKDVYVPAVTTAVTIPNALGASAFQQQMFGPSTLGGLMAPGGLPTPAPPSASWQTWPGGAFAGTTGAGGWPSGQ